jgi:hypothetical protein
MQECKAQKADGKALQTWATAAAKAMHEAVMLIIVVSSLDRNET